MPSIQTTFLLPRVISAAIIFPFVLNFANGNLNNFCRKTVILNVYVPFFIGHAICGVKFSPTAPANIDFVVKYWQIPFISILFWRLQVVSVGHCLNWNVTIPSFLNKFSVNTISPYARILFFTTVIFKLWNLMGKLSEWGQILNRSNRNSRDCYKRRNNLKEFEIKYQNVPTKIEISSKSEVFWVSNYVSCLYSYSEIKMNWGKNTKKKNSMQLF